MTIIFWDVLNHKAACSWAQMHLQRCQRRTTCSHNGRLRGLNPPWESWRSGKKDKFQPLSPVPSDRRNTSWAWNLRSARWSTEVRWRAGQRSQRDRRCVARQRWSCALQVVQTGRGKGGTERWRRRNSRGRRQAGCPRAPRSLRSAFLRWEPARRDEKITGKKNNNNNKKDDCSHLYYIWSIIKYLHTTSMICDRILRHKLMFWVFDSCLRTVQFPFFHKNSLIKTQLLASSLSLYKHKSLNSRKSFFYIIRRTEKDF